MNKFWIPLQSISPSGLVKSYDEQETWNSLFKEFDVPCTIAKPISATVEMNNQDAGLFFKGKASGGLLLPCNRCCEDTVFTLDISFSSFEPFPGDGLDDETDLSTEVDDAVIRRVERGNGLEVNPLALAWQEIILALPVKPVCDIACKGLCFTCGANLNTGSCDCEKDKGDPRLATLRSLQVKK